MNNYYVYIHLFPNGKRYIGITKRQVNQRWGNGEGYSKQPVYKAIKKYGWDNIKHQIILKNVTREIAVQKEKELISIYNTTNKNFGYNHTTGGDGLYNVTEEARKRMSIAQKGIPCSEKTKQINRERRLGKPRPISEILKTAEKLRGRKHPMTEDTRQKIIESIRNMPIDKKREWREKIRKKLIGKKTKPHKGKVVLQKDILTKNIINKFNSISEASKFTKVDRKTISSICNRSTKNNTNVACGFIWEFENSYINTIENEPPICDITNIKNIDYSPLNCKIKEMNITQTNFFKLCKVSTYCQAKINKKVGLSFKTMQKISNFLNCKPNDLYIIDNTM